MPVIEMTRLDADSLRELVAELIAANKALALKVDGLERAVEALKKPAGFPDWMKEWPRPVPRAHWDPSIGFGPDGLIYLSATGGPPS